MLDGVSLDQLRTFIAAAEEGNFSAAGRRLRRAQSVVSQTLANLEGQIGVRLFDRGGRVPMLTDEGRALLARARAVATEVDLFKARAKGLANGLETELSLVVDAMFPVTVLACAAAAFQVQFPAIPLRLPRRDAGSRSGPPCSTGAAPDRPYGILAAGTPAAVQPRAGAHRQSDQGGFTTAPAGGAPRADSNERPLRDIIQLVHADHSNVWRAGEFWAAVAENMAPSCDLAAKHHFLRAGFGFGIMPLHMVEADLASGGLGYRDQG